MDRFFSLFDMLSKSLQGRDKWDGWVDQAESPLGRNTHCKVVRRRIAEAAEGQDPGAFYFRGRYWLSPGALEDERRRLLKAPPPLPRVRKIEPEPAPDSHRARLLAKLKGVR
jgi:hypothetical protein